MLDIDDYVFNIDFVRLEVFILCFEKVLCVGMNYRDYCREQGVIVLEEFVVFGKFLFCIIGFQDDLYYLVEIQVGIVNIYVVDSLKFILYSMVLMNRFLECGNYIYVLGMQYYLNLNFD